MGLDMYVYDSYGEKVAYWRKFNSLHGWMVKNVQDGIDECQQSEIPREKIQQLVEILGIIKEVPQKAEVLMPATDGFFFGSTQYDQYFLDDVNTALDAFQDMLQHPDQTYFYQASW